MWQRYRKWKHAALLLLHPLIYIPLKRAPAGSVEWLAALIMGGVLGLAYVAEEVVWNIRGSGRPCSNCGGRVRMKSFRVRLTCSHCGKPL